MHDAHSTRPPLYGQPWAVVLHGMRYPPPARRALASLTLAACLAVGTLAAAPVLQPLGDVVFLGAWDDAVNFSGAVRVGNDILVASDEIGRLQTGTVDAAFRVTRGPDIPLPGPLGVELDLEALAVNGSTVYALGSHSSTRSSSDAPEKTAAKNLERLEEGRKPRPARDVLFRFTYDAATHTASAMAPASLRAAIDGHKVLSPFVALPSKENGIDLEGLAVDGTTLFAGFRGPVLRHGFVPVLRFAFEQPAAGTVLYVPLDGRGIRDLVKVSTGLLVLAGPMGDGDAPHRVYLWNGQDCIPGKNGGGGTLRFLGDVPAARGGKAEALMLTAETATHYDVAVLYDSVDKGGGARFRIAKAAGAATPATELCGQQPSS